MTTPHTSSVATWLLALLCLWANLASTLEHPKFVPSPHANPLAGRYIVEFSDTYSGSPSQFLDDLDRNYDWSLANDLSSDVFRGISLHLQHNASRVHAATSDAKGGLLQAMHQMMDKEHVKRVFPVVEVPRPKTLFNSVSFLTDVLQLPEDPSVHLPFAHQMTQVDRVQEMGIQGKNIVVGIIDTGVDYRHPSLGGGFGPGFKVSSLMALPLLSVGAHLYGIGSIWL